jgi:hypothetical protein
VAGMEMQFSTAHKKFGSDVWFFSFDGYSCQKYCLPSLTPDHCGIGMSCKWKVWFQNAITAKSKISELTTGVEFLFMDGFQIFATSSKTIFLNFINFYFEQINQK